MRKQFTKRRKEVGEEEIIEHRCKVWAARVTKHVTGKEANGEETEKQKQCPSLECHNWVVNKGGGAAVPWRRRGQ